MPLVAELVRPCRAHQFEADARDPILLYMQLTRSPGRKIYDAIGNKRAAVVYPHDDRAPVRKVRDSHVGVER